MDTTPDEALLAQFLKGDTAALGELARRYERPLLGLAAALLDGRTDMAADAIQETWVRVIRFGSRFNARSAFKTWLYRIAINQCRTAKKRATDSPGSAGESVRLPTPQDEALDDLPHLRDALRALAPDRRIIILLCYHRGMTHEQAADILGTPVGTLKTRRRAAMTELRAKLHAETQP
jgi:RNA polymerase sigma-70 factor (ECF subfamily)